MANNTRLIEEFSQLEKLCNDIYGDKHGVTIYIDEMKSMNLAGARQVAGWRSDLEGLINVRHKRNQLSHGEVSFDEPYATLDDISFISNFKRRILKQTDPLAMLQRARSTKVKTDYTYDSASEGSTNLGPFLLTLFVIFIGVIFLIALFSK